ncbi:beta-galactosidase [Streptacidiphilus sp. P02-A3a]|uniref:beta-galactosidase n=1 Tax=Streptacidiphilus sp. P02-A3a TaxID=2704468 RepID=UPI0015FB47D5|nr:beta-galactosidase [Streptacidiphilus sp. P02-A3a]QMU69360.1 hypothetical protein GXP74_15025 [Streptacidiphilus sp. P02-A3a]
MPHTSKPSGRRTIPLLAAAAVVAASDCLVPPASAATSTHATATATTGAPKLWATQLQFDDNGTPWSVAQFQAIAAKGMDSVEINMPWTTIEPSQGTFSFTELDTELANATAAGIRIVPIFWQAGWSGSPAAWITDTETTSTGGTGVAPPWWNLSEQQDAATGQALPQVPERGGGACVPLSLDTATAAEWKLVPGPAPAGTPVPASCSTSAGGAGSDGNLTVTAVGGRSAYQTWTSAQSGVGPANAYLQLDPGSAVARAATVTLTVTYWSQAGQGFTAQYDTPANPYRNGPTVTGSGSGSWQTATLTLTGARFDEAQNIQSDLRLAVTDPGRPLYLHSVQLSTGAQ